MNDRPESVLRPVPRPFLETPASADWYAEKSKAWEGEPSWVSDFGISLFLAVVLGGTGIMGAGLLRPSGSPPAQPSKPLAVRSDLRTIVAAVDASFRDRWAEQKLVPAAPAAELAVMRRLALVLCGSVPSLEEIRRFEARPKEGRIEAWLDDLLGDRRCADYLAERFARAFVGTEDGPFLLYRRRRFVAWLSDALLENRPYDALVRDLIADRGLWTDHPATNFVTVTFDPDAGRPTPDRLAARVARAFLGVRIDCAQCHDHPFQPWKQADFRGLAAFFGGVHSDLRGIRDAENDYMPPDRKTKEPVKVEPRVPFCPELLPETGSPREQLAAWVVDRAEPELRPRDGQPRLGPPVRPAAGRAGRRPPRRRRASSGPGPPGRRFRRTRLRPAPADPRHRRHRGLPARQRGGRDALEAQEEAWAVFPMTRLRPEQVAGALFQSASLTTLGPQSHWFIRLVTYTGRNDFVRRYGDTGEDEFDAAAARSPSASCS